MVGIQTGMIVSMGQGFRGLNRFLGLDRKPVESHVASKIRKPTPIRQIPAALACSG
jgi:hypothetical protein